MKVVYLSTSGDDTVILPYPIVGDDYICGIVEMNGKVLNPKESTKNPYRNLYLCSNVVDESFVTDLKIPVMRMIPRRNNLVNVDFKKIIWLKVNRPHISSIRLYIADESGEIVSLPKNKLNCTLLFVPIHYSKDKDKKWQ